MFKLKRNCSHKYVPPKTINHLWAKPLGFWKIFLCLFRYINFSVSSLYVVLGVQIGAQRVRKAGVTLKKIKTTSSSNCLVLIFWNLDLKLSKILKHSKSYWVCAVGLCFCNVGKYVELHLSTDISKGSALSLKIWSWKT